MEHELKKQSSCSPYNILIRGESAKYSRECQRIEREQRQIANTFKHNVRKLKVAQRGVDSLLGHQQYISCVNQENILFEHNQPGFCYRSNGDPRRQTSLAESKTRRIVHDMDGREGILPELAANVVSDNPVMSEVLSSPEIVSILCDLRTTAALLDNKQLFDQFALAMAHNSTAPLPFKTEFGEDPLTCLRRYRTNLIQEFFESLQLQAEIRLSRGVPNEVALKYLLSLPKGPDGPLSPLERAVGGDKGPLSSQEWNDALLSRLREAQHERFRTKFANYSGEVSPESPTSEALSPTTTAANVYRQQLRGFGIRGIQSLRTVTPSNYGFRKFKKISAVTIAPLPPPNTKTEHNNAPGSLLVTTVSSGLQTPRTYINGSRNEPPNSYSSRLMLKMKRNRESMKRRYRDEFDSFVKSLISEVENVAEVGNTINEMRRKNPWRTTPTTRPLVKLLRKKSLFSSLNEDDLIFYEFEGGRQDAEKELAQELNLPGTGTKSPTGYLKPGGFTFHVPSRAASVMTIPVDSNTHHHIDEDTPKGSPVSASDLVRSSTASTGGLLRRAHALGKELPDCCGQRSLKRVCCVACAAKLRQECHKYQDRDQRDQMLTELATWKTPGNSELWIKNYTPAGDSVKQHLMSGIPISLRKSYNLYSAQPISMAAVPEAESILMSKDLMSPQVDGLHSLPSLMDTPMPGQRGAPTPILPRRKFLPGFSTYSSVPHTPPKSHLQRTARIFTKRGNQSKNALSARTVEAKDFVKGADSGTLPGSSEGFHPDPVRRRQSKAWTLKVSKLDIMRLRHELDTESIREKIMDFQNTMTRKNEEIHKSLMQ